ncbi:sensor histidine kinase [Paenibacillus sp. FSL H8-0034]|uniref:sensor histidine kinase n=1 Tax=Paenibacillus sp. FSL H8-0034 TaxID=2954671 RepID=UPI0030F52CD9
MTKPSSVIDRKIRGSLMFSFVWLIYLIIPINALLHKSASEMWIGFSVLVLFVLIYLLSYLDSSRRLLCVMGLFVIIGFFCLHYDQSFIFMGFYTAAIVGMLPTNKQFIVGMAAQLVVFILVLFFSGLELNESDMINFIPSMLVMTVMPIVMRGVFRSKELRSKLNMANDEIARLVKNEERQRISRDLHDTLGHTLSLIALKSELAEKMISINPERAIQETKDIQTTARAALKQVRELVSDINAVTISEELAHAEQILSAAGIDLHVQGKAEAAEVPPLIQNILGMCLRELVTNVVKHSKAKQCFIECTAAMDPFTLTIRDDGVGTAYSASVKSQTCAGLRGISERLELVEGKLQFHSAPGEGTRVSLVVPKVVKNVKIRENQT